MVRSSCGSAWLPALGSAKCSAGERRLASLQTGNAAPPPLPAPSCLMRSPAKALAHQAGGQALRQVQALLLDVRRHAQPAELRRGGAGRHATAR